MTTVRVCAVSDVECSRGCAAGPCWREQRFAENESRRAALSTQPAPIAQPVQPAYDTRQFSNLSNAAKHWHDLYMQQCQKTHDDAARYGAEIVALELEIAQDSKDAELYRWLINNCGFGIRRNGVTELTVALYENSPDSIHDLSSAIDAAITAKDAKP